MLALIGGEERLSIILGEGTPAVEGGEEEKTHQQAERVPKGMGVDGISIERKRASGMGQGREEMGGKGDLAEGK